MSPSAIEVGSTTIQSSKSATVQTKFDTDEKHDLVLRTFRVLIADLVSYAF